MGNAGVINCKDLKILFQLNGALLHRQCGINSTRHGRGISCENTISQLLCNLTAAFHDCTFQAMILKNQYLPPRFDENEI